MYTPEHFKLENLDIIHEVIEKYPFAVLISTIGAGLEATHVPLLLSKDRYSLVGHMAVGNPLLQEDSPVLCVFHGPHAYISPSWYESEQTVPTWNYISVHAKGILRLLDKDLTEKVLQDSILYFESENSNYGYQTPKPEIRNSLLGKIKGFEINQLSYEAKLKLSQNHPLERRKRVINSLELSKQDQDQELAEWMRRINDIHRS
ncbi:FMN-binding negative transcriptional regulator [Leptospira licerasiae]|uniref:FMN-binding negative transcriptional regulator n=1 Tax=Leptospira licerasiae TaxID=447106 RepID=UPI001083EC4C|nr:FMN-binding negative transcriptional regulator [Leptospira licerasiae]TGM88646.1 FMN-binding negative transcriptional regulator [Leptospira licerasiae]